MMIEEKREGAPNFDAYAYTVDLETDQERRKTLNSFDRDFVLIKDFKSVQMVWYCSYLENKISYLNWNGDYQAADLCKLLEGKHTAK